ncbi:sigma-70 family RNA polymerase sigma factor [Catenovulum sediminis]|uniref:sigma-70 family RNA polymerase sigma factor n=1 Tax=Catenovulum sediminis TaxID=1740262 RepID=UPI00163D6210|nr:sigma-70 family RNA polymerase sigma factor [Catenovulum sediminis]
MSALHKESYKHLGDAVELWLNYECDKGSAQRNLLFDFYEPWVRKVTNSLFKRYYCPNLEWADYYNLASLASIQAIEIYNVGLTVPFEGFAYKYLKGKILDEIKSTSVPKNYTDLSIRERYDSLIEHDDEDIFGSVIDAIVGMAFGQLIELGITGVVQAQNDFVYNPEHCANSSFSGDIVDLIAQLPKEQKRVIEYHYYQQCKFVEIADILHITKARVSQLHKQAISAIRALYEKNCA